MDALCLTHPRQFKVQNRAEPVAPGAGEALVAVRAVGVCGTDLSGYLGKMPFIQCPRVMGHELGVEVLAVGEGDSGVRPGDRCSVEPYLNCGVCHSCSKGRGNCCERLRVLGVHCDGGLTERLLIPAKKLHPSESLSFNELALVETLGIGCHAVNRAAIQPCEDALIVGAGPIGLAVLEFARLKTDRVTVVERHGGRRAFVQANYPTVRVAESADEQSADVVFDATGQAQSMAGSLQWARFGGRIVYVGITSEPLVLDDALFHRRELTLMASRNALPEDFPSIIKLLESEKTQVRSWIGEVANFARAPLLFEALVSGELQIVKAVIRIGRLAPELTHEPNVPSVCDCR